MSKLRIKEFGFDIRIWSKNFDEKMAYSDIFHLTYSVFNDSNWLQGRMRSVVGSSEEFINWIVTNHPDKTKIIPAVVVLVASHQAQRTTVIDPVVSLLSLFYSIQKLVD